MESQVDTLNGVNLTNTEAISRILIRLSDVENRKEELPQVREERGEEIGELTDTELEEKFKLHDKNGRHKRGNEYYSSRRLTVKSALKERKNSTGNNRNRYSSSEESSSQVDSDTEGTKSYGKLSD